MGRKKALSNVECKIEGCYETVLYRGWCRTHYHKWRLYGDPLYIKRCEACDKPVSTEALCRSCAAKRKWERKEKRLCGMSGCMNKHYSKGFCKIHYERMKYMGTIESRKVPDLPNEEWRNIDRPNCEGLKVSNMGRIKSCRRHDEVLFKSRMIKVNPRETQLTRVASSGASSGNILVHMEVLRAFHSNVEGDFRSFFIDGDRSNCKAENLRWYGKEYLIGEAIKIAEKSDHPLAPKFKLFFLGDYQALNGWFEEQKKWVKPYMRNRLYMFRVPYCVDIENCVQETMLQVFSSLSRGMIKGLTPENLKIWIKAIAKKVLASTIRDLSPTISFIPNEQGNSEEEFDSVADLTGWCHPSAELEAIYRQESR